MDVLKKHHSKGMTPTTSRLPDPRAMAEIRGGLEDESSEAEMVCTHCVFLNILQLNLVIFSYIAGFRTRYDIATTVMPSADAVPVGQNEEEMSTNEYEMTYNRCE